MIRYFNSQNARIDKGEIGGYKVSFSSMLINEYVAILEHLGISD